MHLFPRPAMAERKLRLGDVAAGMLTFSPLAMSRMPRLPIASDTAFRICPLNRRMKRLRLTELLLLAVEAAVDDADSHAPPSVGARASLAVPGPGLVHHDDLRTRRYHSQSRRTCFSV